MEKIKQIGMQHTTSNGRKSGGGVDVGLMVVPGQAGVAAG